MKTEHPGTTSRLSQIWHRLLGFGFRLLYNELAWSYDLVSWIVSLGKWRSWQRSGLAFLEGESVLELAHGPGHMLPVLEAAGYNVVGVDQSAAMISLASARLRRKKRQLPLIRARGEGLPFAPQTFDSILVTFPSEFAASRETIASTYEVLKTDGRIVIVLEARLTGNSLLHRSVEYLYRITGQRQAPTEQSEIHPFWTTITDRYTEQGYRLRLKSVDLTDSQVKLLIAKKLSHPIESS